MSIFWKNWLTVWAWAVVLFGVALAGFAFEASSSFTRLFYTLIGNPVALEPGQHMRFAMGLIGCITVGWGITFMAAFKAAHMLTGQAAASIWRLTTAAVVIWYVIDSSISAATGFPLNAVSNTVLLALYLIPIRASGALKGAS